MATVLHSYCTAGSCIQACQLRESNYNQKYWTYLPLFREKRYRIKQRQKSGFDSSHRAMELPTLPIGTTVFLPDRQKEGHIVGQPACHSYIVSTPSGNFRQNRQHINSLPVSLYTPLEPNNTNSGETDTTSKTVQPPTNPPQPPLHQHPSHWNNSIPHSGRVSCPP